MTEIKAQQPGHLHSMSHALAYLYYLVLQCILPKRMISFSLRALRLQAHPLQNPPSSAFLDAAGELLAAMSFG